MSPYSNHTLESLFQPIDQVHAGPEAKRILKAALVFGKVLTDAAAQTPSLDRALAYVSLAADMTIRSIATGI